MIGCANSLNASLVGTNCIKMAITGINKLVRASGIASVIHKMATIINRAKAWLACWVLKTGKYNKTQKTIIAIDKAIRFTFFLSTYRVQQISNQV